MRLDKLLSNLGYCSRNEVKKLIAAELVLVRGEPAKKANMEVSHVDVSFDGEALDPAAGMVLMLHKPCGYTVSRREDGLLVYELLPERFTLRKPALSAIGRLDKESSGLLLFTDDGDLLHRVTSPRNAISKRYRVELARTLRGDEAEIFLSGTLLLKDDPVPLRPATLTALSSKSALVTISEGRYHQVRRMFAALGNHVEALKREAIGALDLGALAEGEFRILSADEIALITKPEPVSQ